MLYRLHLTVCPAQRSSRRAFTLQSSSIRSQRQLLCPTTVQFVWVRTARMHSSSLRLLRMLALSTFQQSTISLQTTSLSAIPLSVQAPTSSSRVTTAPSTASSSQSVQTSTVLLLQQYTEMYIWLVRISMQSFSQAHPIFSVLQRSAARSFVRFLMTLLRLQVQQYALQRTARIS